MIAAKMSCKESIFFYHQDVVFCQDTSWASLSLH